MTWAESGFGPFLQWLVPIEHELLVFAAFWLVVGLIDEFAVDLTWVWLKLTGRARTTRLPHGFGGAELTGPTAVLVPAYDEAGVIATTITHMLRTWHQRELRLYIGCYANDAATIAVAAQAASDDPRVRVIVHAAHGPTTKADCLNRLYAALTLDEARGGQRFRAVILHDSEDMVHPAALQAIDMALTGHDFVQIPVRPALQANSRWIAGHYADEFAEAHTKTLVMRAAVGAAIPAAGVGCGFSRSALARLADLRAGEGESGPFATDCLTEDYELGLTLSRGGRGSTFLRLRDAGGNLVATSSYFPGELPGAVRQKTRWVHGIAFQAWDRMGWSARPMELWMALRDRRGPLTALVLFAAYLLLLIETVLIAAHGLGWAGGHEPGRLIGMLTAISLVGFVWRAAWRMAFTAREYGWAEGLRAVLRIPVGNIIAIMAGRRALGAYVRSLRGQRVVWDKTAHHTHPADQAVMINIEPRGARA
ncbi:MAG: glycosyl transferase family protein [Proteobacteria bacterium]|nr:glycosyl transferase family protein [Pseudomonadota bacterium]